MTTWQAFQDAVKAWVLLCTGLGLAVWENESRPHTPQAYALLSWVSAPRVGTPELVYTHDPDAVDPLTDMIPTTRSQRVFVLQISVQSFSQAALVNGRQYLERGPERSHWPRAHALLAAQNASLASWGDALAADLKLDERYRSGWLCEVRLNAAVSETDADGAIGRIASVEVSSDLEGVDGQVLPVPPNFEEKVLP